MNNKFDACSCGHCHNMPTERQNVCCQGTDKIREHLEHGMTCITEHEGFLGNCLNLYVLEASFYEFLEENGPEGDEEMMHRLKSEDSGEEDNTEKGSSQEKEIVKDVVKPGKGEHPLQYAYTFWFSRRPPGKQTSAQNFDQNLKKIGALASVEQFWSFFSHMLRPCDLSGHSDYHIFKEGIRPMWEDDANKHGGKWIIRLRKGLASRCWENLVLAMVGEQFMVGDEICGTVISVRYQEDILSLWNRTACDTVTTSRIRDTLKRVLNLPPNTVMEYKTHNDSLKDLSSFRNTDLFMR